MFDIYFWLLALKVVLLIVFHVLLDFLVDRAEFKHRRHRRAPQGSPQHIKKTKTNNKTLT